MSNRLSLHAILVSGASAGGQLVMLVVFAALGREIGPTRLGVVTISMALAMVLSGLVDFGANNLWVRDLASGALPKSDYSRRATTKVLVGIGLGALISFVCLAVPPARPFGGIGVILSSWILTQTLHVALRADSRNTSLAVSLVSERAVLLVLYLGAALLGVHPEIAFFLSYALGALVGAGVAFALMDPAARPFRGLTRLPDAWRGAQYFGLGAIMINLSSLDSAIAGAVAGNTVVGYYGAVNRWTQPIMLASNTFTTLLVPVAAREPTMRDVWGRIRSTMWLPAGGAALCVLMGVFAEPLVLLIMGEQYAPSVPVLQILAVAVAIININQPLAGLLQARGHDRRVALLLAVAVLVRLGVLVPLVLIFGAMGIALAFVMGEAILLLGMVAYARALRAAPAERRK
ncbi:MAG TPA: hypothetical protein GXZ30_12780 [Propionibacterium sp.]|nr:hypothetical protein [Propionibacterium sp.]